MIESIKSYHQHYFKDTPEAVYFAPGRVNLIGEHTDYSGGYVFPAAIHLGIYGALSFRDDTAIHVFSQSFSNMGVITLDEALKKDDKLGFGNYLQAVLWAFKDAGYTPSKGFNLTLDSDLPDGAGLSSSAALEILFAYLINDVFDFKLPLLSLVLLAKKAENEYMGVASGIMDQFAVAFGKAEHAMCLNTDSLDVTYVPFSMANHTLVLTNTHKKRTLVSSAYNERFTSVETVGRGLKKPLGQTTLSEWDVYSETLPPLLKKRGRHVVSENARTLEAIDALETKAYVRFGALLNASHTSLKDDFEVSCEELDFLVEGHRALGALGARMTGAGFGGTMLALYQGTLPSFDALIQAYQDRFDLTPEMYLAKISDGVKRLI